MIERITGFKVGQQFFTTIEEAQTNELGRLLLNKAPRDTKDLTKGVLTEAEASVAAMIILENKDTILDILTMTPESRPRARKIHGGTKTRKAKATPSADDNSSVGPPSPPKPPTRREYA